MKSRTILHVDMDAFYASVEQRERPATRGQPVIVGAGPKEGRGRGVVAACSYEAREYGIHSALPISRAWQLCPQGVYLRPNGALYGKVSGQIMEILRRFTDLVEPISIDEAFLDVTGSARLFGDGEEIARAVKDRILREQELPCSIGVAGNKFVAKVASDANKPDGLCVVPRGEEKKFLASLPIRKIWGVGPKSEKRLQRWGVRTIGEIADRDQAFWVEKLGSHGTHLWHLSQGLDDRPVRASRGFKSLSHESTFEEDCRDPDKINRTLLALSEKVARRCRSHGLGGGCIRLKWRFADFSTFTRQRKVGEPTDDAHTIFRVALELCRDFLPLAQAVRLVGVGISDFEKVEGASQPMLFEAPAQKKRRLDASVDEITRRFGKQAVRNASLLDRERDEEDGFSSFLTN